ncbi:TetR/AcrR family transcriptional regulator [Paracoccus cavernae]|uniref:TetR/AcrR family transcriptional regulator n=1 Tax=Paracoccus cavernae TaxID=1571207 RepID=A0ABT8DAY9_9RHOB|nr:TetR/AcrR family transcriptional regulator [Paracoccus cavernae]
MNTTFPLGYPAGPHRPKPQDRPNPASKDGQISDGLPGDGQPAPEDNPKRRQILDGARRMFLAKGFEAASMQDVARAAKVSKGTLYVYFDSKEAMFESLVLAECSRMQQAIREIGSGAGAIGDELRRIARHVITTLMSGDVMASMRMMIGAGEKFPDLARYLYTSGPERSIQSLADYFGTRVARGDLVMPDCREAASEFLDMIIAGLQRRALLMMPPLAEDELDAFIARRVARFLSLYPPQSAGETR